MVCERKNKQRLLAEMLKQEDIAEYTRLMSKERWVDMLRAAGLDDEGMLEWHRQFETNHPQAHQDFLESLNISEKKLLLLENVRGKKN